MSDLGPSPPRALGRYALYDQIASGGMATVHLGRLRGSVGFARTVAIKRMRPQIAEDPESLAMFLDEARLAARIHHPNVVPTLDVVSAEGELFIVMEYVRGESLSRLLREVETRGERIAPEMVATIMVGVLHGLHAAHEAKNEGGEPLGVVHRDVSPHNILVGVDGAPRVVDFGIAKAIGRAQTTREGQLKGKLAYMAPEQIEGKATRATDVYAASVVLWEALTGRRLFSGENDAQTLDLVLQGCTVPPSSHAPGLPAALDEAALRGLSVDPANRFASAREMARALEDAIALVPPSKIGEWVEAVAKGTLGVRDERIAAIESSSSAPHVEDATATQNVVLTRSSERAHRASAPPVPRRRHLALGALALAGGGLFLITGRGGTASTTAVVAPPPAPPSFEPSMPAASAALAPVVAADDARGADVTPTLGAQTVPPSSASRRPPTPSPPAAKCDPPWYFDDRGLRIFKKECL